MRARIDRPAYGIDAAPQRLDLGSGRALTRIRAECDPTTVERGRGEQTCRSECLAGRELQGLHRHRQVSTERRVDSRRRHIEWWKGERGNGPELGSADHRCTAPAERQ